MSHYNPQGKTIYIGNLNYNFQEKDLDQLFSKYGKIKFINLIRNKEDNKSKGIAFIDMFDPIQADKAIKSLNGKVLGSRTIKVSEAIENGKEQSMKSKQLTAHKKEKTKEIKEVALVSKPSQRSVNKKKDVRFYETLGWKR